MSLVQETETEFERNARVVLGQSISRIDGRTRSRLNQARQAALEAAARRRRPLWWLRPLALMPAAGAVAAAALVALVLWHREPSVIEAPMPEQGTAVEDMDLLADSEGLDLMEGWDGPFYEWAVAQTDGNGESDS
jgi:hypothetical protein